MSKTMKWKDLAWLLLAACLLTLLLPWMKLNENGVTAGDLLDMIQPMPREELELELRGSFEDLSETAAREGYTIDANGLTYSVMGILDGNLRLWQIPRVASAMGNIMPELAKVFREMAEDMETDPYYANSYNADYYVWRTSMYKELADDMDRLAERWHTEALLYWVLAGLALAGLILAAVCILRGKSWGCYVFFGTVLAPFVLNLVAVHRNNALPEMLLRFVQEEIPTALMRAEPDFFHVGGASVCCLILAALLVLHARFDLIDLFSRLTLRPATAPTGSPAAPSELPAEQPEEPAIPAEQPEETPEETTETSEASAVQEETAETPAAPAEPEETNEPSVPEETPEEENQEIE